MDEALSQTLEAGRQRNALLEREGPTLVAIGHFLADVIRRHQKIYVFGEGSCARVASHLADELLTCTDEQVFMPVSALRFDATMLASVAGDDSVIDHVYSRQIDAFVSRGDALIALCFSGRVPSVTNALQAGRIRGAVTIGLVGGYATLPEGICDHEVHFRAGNAAAALECHLAVGHLLRRVVERDLAGIESSDGDEELRAAVAAAEERDAAEAAAAAVSVEVATPAEPAPAEAATATAAGPAPSSPGRTEVIAPPSPSTHASGASIVQGMIRFRCLHCQEVMTVEGKFAGRSGQCPHCLNPFTVPTVEEIQEAQAAPATTATAPAPAPAPAAEARPASKPSQAIEPPAKAPSAAAAAKSKKATKSSPAAGQRRRIPANAAKVVAKVADMSSSSADGPVTVKVAKRIPAGGDVKRVAAAKGGLKHPAAHLAALPGQVGPGPGDGKHAERRVFARFGVQDAMVRFDRDKFPTDESMQNPVENLSRSGVGFTRSADRGAVDLQSGEKIFLRFDVPAFKDPILAEALVERVERVGAGARKGYRVGCRFVAFEEDGEGKLRRLAENVCLRGIRRG